MFGRNNNERERDILKAAGLYIPETMPPDNGLDTLHHMHHLMLKTPYKKCLKCREEEAQNAQRNRISR